MQDIAKLAGVEMTPAARGIEDVTRDIWNRARNLVREGMEIGRLLYEAKAMVPAGEWGKYIEEEMPFSHSWANNYMRLYKVLGNAQTSLFGDSHALVNLSVTQALELLTLSPEDREEFMRQNDVAAMSTRELHQAIKERDEARAEATQAQAMLEDARRDADSAREEAQKAEEECRMSINRVDALTAAEQALQADLSRAEKALKKAKEAEANARQELEQLQNNPEVPESVMARLRQEAEVSAAKKATEAMQKKLDAAAAAAKKAQERQAAAEREAQAAKAKLDEAQKAQRISDPDLQAMQVLSGQILAMTHKLKEHCRKAVQTNGDVRPNVEAFMKAVPGKVAEVLGEVK